MLKNGHSHIENESHKLNLHEIECNNENDETDKNNNKENTNLDSKQKEFKRNKNKNRGKTVHIKPETIEKEDLKPGKPKFIKNKRKSATLIGNVFKLSERLQGIEKGIPVMYETLVSKNVGNPGNYYKKIRELGSGSYGSV